MSESSPQTATAETSGDLSALEMAREAVSVLVDEGVRDVVLCPGSRNAPLSYALSEQLSASPDSLRVHVRIDERSAAFLALGLSLATGLPVPIATTSGSAVGNLMPAVMEANHAGIALLVLSADRPEELHGTGANQTTLQNDLFGDHVRFAANVPAGESAQRALRTAIDVATGALVGYPSGPAHVNIAFRDPLTPLVEARSAAEPKTPTEPGFPTVREGSVALPAAGLHVGGAQAPERIGAEDAIDTARTVVIAGHGAGPIAAEFAQDLGLPLLAEPSSNARYSTNAIVAYPWLLDIFAVQIERVVVFGRPTLSRPVSKVLSGHIPGALYAPTPVTWFEAGRRPERMVGELSLLARFAGRAEDGWLARWQRASAAAHHVLSHGQVSDDLDGLTVARAVWQYTAGPLVVGSSNPIRDLDLAAQPTENSPWVFADRGLAGIDGTVSLGHGVALGSGQGTRVYLGDLTFLHDVGGLLVPELEAVPDVDFVVYNDGGGGIFTLLEHGEVGQSPRYAHGVERFFGTAQSVDLAAIAAAYGLEYVSVRSASELAAALSSPIVGRRLLEVRGSRNGLRQNRSVVREAVQRSARAAAEA